MMFKYPAVVVSYDANTRLAKIKLEPLDDGADTQLDAELLYPLGDKSNTAIEVLAGDFVWVEFEQGDPRYPIIVGYRNQRTGNDDLTRRYHHHGNFEILADNIIKIKGNVKVIVESETVEVIATTVNVTANNTNINSVVAITGNTSITGNLAVAGAISGTGGSGASIAGNVTVSSGDVVADGKSLKTHTHPYTDDGSPMTTGVPS